MGRAAKGGEFEREICKLLSKWWTGGLRDDVFWRSSQSGGRATQRAKKGLGTYGSYGDIAAVDPAGDPLVRMFTIELKRGDSHGNPFDLLTSSATTTQRPFEAALIQARKSHQLAQSYSWMLIHRRDRHRSLVYLPTRTVNSFAVTFRPPVLKFRLPVNLKPKGFLEMAFTCVPLETFLETVTPAQIIKELKFLENEQS